MLNIIYSSLLFKKKNDKENLNNIYEKIIYPINDLYSYKFLGLDIILTINLKKIKELIKIGKIIPQRKQFFNVLIYYQKNNDNKIINNIFSNNYSKKIINISYSKKFNSKEILKIDDCFFNLQEKSINLKNKKNNFEGGIYLEKYTYGRYNRNLDLEKIMLKTEINNNKINNDKIKKYTLKNRKPNLICISVSRIDIWKEILKNKKFLLINNISIYKKLYYKEILEYDFILLTINVLNNSYYKNKLEDYKIDNQIQKQSFINSKNDILKNENILWEIEPVFHLYNWNNYILDFLYEEIKKNMNDNLLNFDCSKKWIIYNQYQENKNYNKIFNLFNDEMSTLDISKFIIKNSEFEIKMNLNLKKEFLNFNNKEREGYNQYINDLKEIYNKEKLKFEDDEYLQKYCSYPQKQIKINKILKNLNDNDKFDKINKKYKNFIQKQIKEEELDCKICLEKINSNNLGLTNCGHFFCYSCIYKNINYSKKCPNCRENISLDKIYYVTDNTQKIVIDLDILDELGTKISSLLTNIKNYNNVLIISNFDDCLNKIHNLLLQFNIDSIITKMNSSKMNSSKMNSTKMNSIYLSNYDEDFMNKNEKINTDVVIFIEPYYSKNILIKLYDIFKFTNQKNFKFLIFRDTIEETYLNTCNINSICGCK